MKKQGKNRWAENPQKGKARVFGVELTREVTPFAEVRHCTLARCSRVQRVEEPKIKFQDDVKFTVPVCHVTHEMPTYG